MANAMTGGWRSAAFRHPALALLLLLAVAVGSVSLVLGGIPRQGTYDAMMDRTLPEQGTLQAVIEHFGTDRWIDVVYECDDPFSSKNLKLISDVTERLRRLDIAAPNTAARPAIRDVLSLTSVKDAYGSEGNFRAALLVPDPTPTEPAALAEIKRRAHANPLLAESYLSKTDARVAALHIQLANDVGEPEAMVVVPKVRDILKDATAASGVTFSMSGKPVLEYEGPITVARDVGKITFALWIIVVVLLWVGFKRVAPALLIGFIIIPVSIAAALAAVPLTHGTLQTFTSLLIPIVVVLSVTTAVHFICEVGRLRQEGTDRATLPIAALVAVVPPLLMTTTTEFVGFIGFAPVSIKAVSQLGLAGAVAVVLLGLVVFLVLSVAFRAISDDRLISPAAFAIGPVSDRIIEWFARGIVRRPGAVLGSALVVALVLTAGATRLTLGATPIKAFGPQNPVRLASDRVDATMGGSYAFVVSIKTPTPGRFENPAELARIEALDAFMRAELPVARTVNPATFIRVMHRAFFNEDDSQLVLPTTGEAVAQLLALNTDDRLYDYVDRDHAWVRILATTPVATTASARTMYRKVEAYLAEHFPTQNGYDAHVTGDFYVLSMSVESGARGVLFGLGTSLLMLVLIFGIIYRSPFILLAAILPNLMPLLVVVGVLGWTGTEAGLTISLVVSITLGMCVDDAFHFISYCRTRLALHGDLPQAVLETCRHKGPAMLMTSSIFILGFVQFVRAEGELARLTGLMTALAVVTAFFGTFAVLPATLLVTKTRMGVGRPSASTPPTS